MLQRYHTNTIASTSTVTVCTLASSNHSRLLTAWLYWHCYIYLQVETRKYYCCPKCMLFLECGHIMHVVREHDPCHVSSVAGDELWRLTSTSSWPGIIRPCFSGPIQPRTNSQACKAWLQEEHNDRGGPQESVALQARRWMWPPNPPYGPDR